MSHHHKHEPSSIERTRAQEILASLSAEEAGAVVAALYDYAKMWKMGDEDPHMINAIAKGISSAALAGHMVPTTPDQYH